MLQASQSIDHDLQNMTGTTRFTWQASDGLTLSAHIWEQQHPSAPPIICLPGLTRNTRDFYHLANFLQESGHHVIAMDYRGRGLSDYSDEFETYNLDQEADDIDRGIKALGIDRFSVIGTSRGGLHSMSIGYRYYNRVLSAIINDIGAFIEPPALQYIVDTVGTKMSETDMKSAAHQQAKLHGKAFTKMSEQNWITFANQLYTPNSNGVRLSYDHRLGDTIRGENKAAPEEDLWPLFNGLMKIPHLLLHGANSGLLSTATVNQMQERHENMELLTVPDQGHAPLLWDDTTQSRILEFLTRYNLT